MTEFKNWKEISKGFYRYVIAANAAYEIQILFHDLGTDILTAQASLFIVGDWTSSKNGNSFFERECLLEGKPVFECLEAAQKDYEENNG